MATASVLDRVTELFADAREVHAQAIELLARDDIRDAAEKAWCATKRATDALILARTGEEPVTTARTSDGLDTWPVASPLPDPYRAVTTAVSTNYTAPASTTSAATLTRNAVSGNRSIHQRRRTVGRGVKSGFPGCLKSYTPPFRLDPSAHAAFASTYSMT